MINFGDHNNKEELNQKNEHLTHMKNITVFCGSSAGFNPGYKELAYELGQELAVRNIGLVYGGAKIGLMGAVADGALSKNGKVTGVLPGFLQKKEITHTGLTQLILVESMHERKLKMFELSDGVIALPGGFGTMEEYFEMLTWGQLGLHKNPIALLNTEGFYDGLLTFADTMARTGFLKPENRELMLADTSISGLLKQMENFQPPVVTKWIKSDEI